MKPPQTQQSDEPRINKITKVANQVGEQNSLAEKSPFAELAAMWQSLPSQAIGNLFVGRSDSDEQSNSYERAYRFKVKTADLAALLAPTNLQVRIHLAADTNYKANQINATPGFVPLIQGYDAGNTDPYANAFLTDWLKAPGEGNLRNGLSIDEIYALAGIEGDSVVNQKTADQFILTWLNVEDNAMGQQFESRLDGYVVTKRVRYFTFSEADSALIKNQLDSYTNPELFVYLGSYQSFSIDSYAFDVCIILEPRGTTVSGKKESNFYEFSSPCPPAC